MIRSNWLYIAVMFAVSYTIRILPLTLIRKPIKNQFIQSFLYYVPYVTAAWFGASLFQVSVACCAVVFVLELFLVH